MALLSYQSFFFKFLHFFPELKVSMLVTQLKIPHESLTFHMVTDESVLTRNTLTAYICFIFGDNQASYY